MYMNMIIQHSKELGEAFEKNSRFTEEMLHIFSMVFAESRSRRKPIDWVSSVISVNT
ncbi:hypothetical protein QKW52_06700 [Bacillus sonorensis]|nr:hypothetical protein [Bacillus sonorensis]